MNESLKAESEKLARSWMQHDAEKLRDYLVASVEDPRLNLQSVFSRHFLLRAVVPGRFETLMEQECRFAAVMNWLTSLAQGIGEHEELEAVLYALKRGSDNSEGLQIPNFVVQTFAGLPCGANGIIIPNYIEGFLAGAKAGKEQPGVDESTLNLFLTIWNGALAGQDHPRPSTHPVLEPACGSANDFRFLHAFGIARLLDYTGFDLCLKNVENARALFPRVRFNLGNVFQIQAPDRSFELCYFHDLLEHLSLEGMETAVKEICRATNRGICAGFFQLDEIPHHIVRPVDEYHWNTLSMARMKELFAAHGFTGQVMHIGSFLREQFGCEETHNANAYTFILQRSAAPSYGS